MVGCSIPGCENSLKGPGRGLSLFKLPKNKARQEHWLKCIGQPVISEKKRSSYRVCCTHFDQNSFRGRFDIRQGLKRDAIPTLHLPDADTLLASSNKKDMIISSDSSKEEDFQESEIVDLEREIANIASSKTLNVIDEDHETTTETKPFDESEIMDLEREIDQIASSSKLRHSNEDTKLTIERKPLITDFFKQKFTDWKYSLKKSYQGYEYNQKFRLFCLNLYCSAPKAYKLFQKCFSLPSSKVLKRTKLILNAGINRNFLVLLSKRLEKMPPNAKHVTLCLDEMDLEKNLYYDIRHDEITGFHDLNSRKFELADRALILRIKGCHTGYEQLIGYTFICSSVNNYKEISRWIENTLQLLFEVGFVVCAIVTNHTSIFCNLHAVKVGWTADKPFYNVNSIPFKIVFMYDIPLLINSIRDILLSSYLIYDQHKIVSWQFVSSFYTKDNSRKIKLAPALTSAHIKPRSSQRSTTNLAKQVFNYDVAAGLSADIEAGHQPPEASTTADFIMKMYNLWYLLDSNTSKERNLKMKYFASGNPLTNCLEDTFLMFQNTKVKNLTDESSSKEDDKYEDAFLNNIATTMRAVLELQIFFKSIGIKCLQGRKLQQKSAEFMSDLKSHHSKGILQQDEKLTAIQFRRCFSTLALKNLLNNSFLTINESDLDSIVCGKKSTDNDFCLLEEYLPQAPKTSALAVGTKDYRFTLPMVNTFQFIGSYLLYKCSVKHKCDTLKEYIGKCKNLVATDQVAQVRKCIRHASKLVVLPEGFRQYLDQCERMFINNNNLLEKNLGNRMLTHIQSCPQMKPCPCFPLDYLHKLFLRQRIYNVVKFRNQNLKRKPLQK